MSLHLVSRSQECQLLTETWRLENAGALLDMQESCKVVVSSDLGNPQPFQGFIYHEVAQAGAQLDLALLGLQAEC